MTVLSILPKLHPDALGFYSVNSNLKSVCDKFEDLSVRVSSFPITISKPFSPMLGHFKLADFKGTIASKYHSRPFWIETKIDGERIQMHMNKGIFTWWSRKFTDYSQSFGVSSNHGSLSQYIHGIFKAGVEKCILDGEMVAWDTKKRSNITIRNIEGFK